MSNARLIWKKNNTKDCGSNSDSSFDVEIDEDSFIIRSDGIHCPSCDELMCLGFLGTIHNRSKKEYTKGSFFSMGEIEIECENDSCPLSKKKIELGVSLFIR